MQEEWLACLRQGRSEPASAVDLAVVAVDNPAGLVESHHSQETALEGSLARVQGTIQVVDHMAWVGIRQVLGDHRDPNRQEDLEGKIVVDIVDDDRKEEEDRLGVKALVVVDQQEQLVDAVEEPGLGEEDEIRSVLTIDQQHSPPLTSKK